MMLLVNAALCRKLFNTVFFVYSLYIQAKDYTIQTLTLHYITIPVLVSGVPNLASATQFAIFLTVHEFIVRTNRFDVVNRDTTEP